MKRKTVSISESEKECHEKKTRSRGRCLGILILCLLMLVVVVVAVVVVVTADDDDDDDKDKDGSATVPPPGDLERRRDSLQTFIGPEPVVRITNFTNWDETVQKYNMLAVAPSTLREVQLVVMAARKALIKIRCVGSAYSFSDLYADEGELLVETAQLRTRHDGPAMQLNQPVPGVDLWTVTAAAGLSQADLREFFLEQGVQYRSTATPFNVLIGGLIGTASHGSSASKATVSDLVVAVRLVDYKGELRSYNSLQHPEEMAMLKCCVGMCGVIYDITFQVERLTLATVTNLFKSSKELFDDTTWLINYLKTSDPLMYWAPLSSVTTEEWQEYTVTGKIPSSYDPWNDQYWIRSYTDTGVSPGDDPDSTGRRKRSLSDYNYSPPLISGKLANGEHLFPVLARQRRDVNTTDEPESTTGPVIIAPGPTVDDTNQATEGPITSMADGPSSTKADINTEAPIVKPTAPATYSDLQTVHQGAWNGTYGWFKDALPVNMSYPDAVMFQDGNSLAITYSMAFTFKDDAVLSNTKKCITLVLEKLKQEALKGKMPLLTIELDWIQPSRNCYLCPQYTSDESTDSAYWLAMTFVGASSKPNYERFMNQIFQDLKAEKFASMRVEWAKFYSFVDGLQAFIKKSFVDTMPRFREVHKREKLDALGMFTNQYLRGIFAP